MNNLRGYAILWRIWKECIIVSGFISIRYGIHAPGKGIGCNRCRGRTSHTAILARAQILVVAT